MKYCEMIFCNEFKVSADKKKSSSATVDSCGGKFMEFACRSKDVKYSKEDFILRIVIFMN